MARLSQNQFNHLIRDRAFKGFYQALSNELAVLNHQWETNGNFLSRSSYIDLSHKYSVFDSETENVVKALILGQDIDAKKQGITPLHKAIQYENFTIVALLLTYGADVNCFCELSQKTPLHLAAELGNVKIYQRLLNYGANSQLTDSNGNVASKLWSPKWKKYFYGFLFFLSTGISIFFKSLYALIVLPTLSLIIGQSLCDSYNRTHPPKFEKEEGLDYCPNAELGEYDGYEAVQTDNPSLNDSLLQFQMRLNLNPEQNHIIFVESEDETCSYISEIIEMDGVRVSPDYNDRILNRV